MLENKKEYFGIFDSMYDLDKKLAHGSVRYRKKKKNFDSLLRSLLSNPIVSF